MKYNSIVLNKGLMPQASYLVLTEYQAGINFGYWEGCPNPEVSHEVQLHRLSRFIK